MLRRSPILLVWLVTASLPAAEPAPDPTVALVDKSDAAFLGHVKAVSIEEATLGPEDAADLNADTCIRRIPDAQPLFKFQAGKSYQFLVAQLVVDDLVKGDVMRGSTLKVRVAAAEGKDALGQFDVGWAEKPADGQSKWEAQVPGGRLFALKADPDGLAFRPLLMDFPAGTADEASAKRKAALGTLCKAYRGKPGFALPETLSDEDILARLHATKVEKLDGGRYRLTYDFTSPEELKDWYVINPLGEWAVADGWLTQSCNESNNEDYMALVLATCAGFSGDVSATVRLNPVDNDCFSVHIAHYCRRQTYTFLMNSDYGKVWEARRVIGKRLAKNEDRLWSYQGDYDQTKTYTICLARKGKTIFVKLDGKLLFSADDEVLTSGSVALGCKGMQGIRYDSVVIEGRFDGRWSQVEPAAPIAKHPEAKAEKPKAQEDAAKPVAPPTPMETGQEQF